MKITPLPALNTCILNDDRAAVKIKSAPTALEAKKEANKLKRHLTSTYHDEKFGIMQEIEDLHAEQCPRYRTKLLETENMTLIIWSWTKNGAWAATILERT